MLKQRPEYKPKKFEGGERFLFRGSYLYLLVAEEFRNKTKVYQDNDRLIVLISNMIPVEKRKSILEHTVKSWFVSKAREIFTERVQHFSHLLNVKYNWIRIKEQKTRWGSLIINKGESG